MEKSPDLPGVIEPDLGFQPGQLLSQAQLVNQLGNGGVADEQVVVASFQLAAVNGEGGGLAAQKRSLLEYLGEMASLGQLVGCGQPGDTTADNADPHGAGSRPAGPCGFGTSSRLDSDPSSGPCCRQLVTRLRRDRFCFHSSISPTTFTGSHSAAKWTNPA